MPSDDSDLAGGAGPAGEVRRRRRLTPAIADVRRAVRDGLQHYLRPGDAVDPVDRAAPSWPLVLVALSGGADSLALAAATAFVAPRLHTRAGAVIVDHGIQQDSAAVAATAAAQAVSLGLDPVIVSRVTVPDGSEAAARTARYEALDAALEKTGACGILLAHTRDDQAETVLLGLARGSGARSLAGMRPVRGRYLRPLLEIPRATTQRFCLDSGLEAWHDPMNSWPRYARVRVRQKVLPVLEAEIGPGVAAALARTASQLREDADALDSLAEEMLEDLCEASPAGLTIPVAALAANPPALRHRILRQAVFAEFGMSLHRVHVLAIEALITDWHGQESIDLPGVRVVRQGTRLVFSAPHAEGE
jgi:tRNA(Ile)-lysidine synthase